MGIGRLTEKIAADARQQAEEVLAKARARVAEIRANAARTVAQLETSARESVENETRAILERARSQARLRRRNLLLAAQWRVIDRVLARAREAVLADPRYSESIARLVDRYRSDGWSVLLSERDARRYGEEQGVGQAPISGGAVLRRHRVEIDLSLDSLLARVREEMVGELARILFPQGNPGG